MPAGTKYAPINVSEYGSKDLNAALRGDLFQAAAGQETTRDFLISDDSLIDGAIVHVLNSALGDKLKCQVVDKNNIFGYGANTVLGQYVTDWYINPSKTEQLDFTCPYPAKIYSGLYLRVVYSSTGASPVDVIVNYKLHKVLS